jgi:hypothetical protein
MILLLICILVFISPLLRTAIIVIELYIYTHSDVKCINFLHVSGRIAYLQETHILNEIHITAKSGSDMNVIRICVF